MLSVFKNAQLLQKLSRGSTFFYQKIVTRNQCRSYSRRALMYVPGDDPKKLNKAFTLTVDCIAMDCEDGVALNRKQAARETIREFLNKEKLKKSDNFDLGVRVNSFASGYCKDDLECVLGARHLPDTILLPKVDDAQILSQFSDEVDKHLKGKQRINLILYIESAKAFVNLKDILLKATTLKSLIATTLVFGSDDFCADIGATRTENSMEILYARQKLILFAKAFNLQAIDMVYIKYKDLEGLKRQSEEGARMGFSGKQVIHPDQIPIVQQAFLPSEIQIKWASGLLKAFEEHQKSGKGAFTYKGSMIDMPTMKQAQNIMKLANS